MSKQVLNNMVAIINRTKQVGVGYYNGSIEEIRVFVAMASRAGLQVKAPTACPTIMGLYSVEVAA